MAANTVSPFATDLELRGARSCRAQFGEKAFNASDLLHSID
jgi:hypothetical protein